MAAAFVWAFQPVEHHREAPTFYANGTDSAEITIGPFPSPLTTREAELVARFERTATAQGFTVERRESSTGKGSLLFVAHRCEVAQ